MGGADQHRYPRRPARGHSGDRVDGQHRCSDYRPTECVGTERANHGGSRSLAAGSARRQAAALAGSEQPARPHTRHCHAPRWPLRLRRARAAGDDRGAEQAGRAGSHQMVADRHPPGRLPGDGDLARVAAERGDVVAHPAQRGLLIGQAVVALARRAQRRVREEPGGPEPVVDRDDDDVALGHQPARVVRCRRCRWRTRRRGSRPSPAVRPRRSATTRSPTGSPHRWPAVIRIAGGVLHTASPAYWRPACPATRHGPGRPPPQFPDRCGGIRNALKQHIPGATWPRTTPAPVRATPRSKPGSTVRMGPGPRWV